MKKRIILITVSRYYDLPFCRPAQIHEEEQTLGENLTGNRKMTSGYEAEFASNIYSLYEIMYELI